MVEHQEDVPDSADLREILLVEDEAADAELTRRTFERGGLLNPLRLLRDGEQALDYLLGHGAFADRIAYPLPGLILLDLKLPKVSGLEVLEQLRLARMLERIPVVILTSPQPSQDLDRALELGACGFLEKSVRLDAFRQVAKRAQLDWLCYQP